MLIGSANRTVASLEVARNLTLCARMTRISGRSAPSMMTATLDAVNRDLAPPTSHATIKSRLNRQQK